MKKLLTALVVFTFLFSSDLFGQAPDGSAPDALIRPHSFGSSASLNGVASPQPGSIAYRSDLGQMFYRNNSAWVQLGGGSSSSGWGLTGNAIGGNINNFIGTTDNSEFYIRSDNKNRLIVMPTPANRHRVLFPKILYFPGSGLNNSGVIGINGTQGRLRITASGDDTFDNTEGASIDLHGNFAEPSYAGRLDLVAGATAAQEAITFWTSNGLAAAFTGFGNFGIGNTNVPNNIKLFVDGNAAKPGGGAWIALSDRRVKRNITPYEKGIDFIMKINPVSYQYTKESGLSDIDKTYVGVIAQEMEEVMPSTVLIVNDSLNSGFTDLRTFDSSEILYTLINSVKELDEKNKALRKENAENRELIEKLKKSIVKN